MASTNRAKRWFLRACYRNAVYRTVLPDDRDRRAGQIVNTTGELVAAIRAVGAALNLTAERERALVQECIADLPPVTL